ncbi:2,3-diaminopropionate biosynthesis protein SbnA [Pseudomonas syringae group genomosp. 3]|uniref:cysteine synthase n=1 Tax=Pseudomonas syringae pv. primulae TaxID=251707 RepID=A0A3M3YCX6_9PSED|nr:2,3-diaminopropionate biosynthesis protein SbnA [Pseudomonas syringae group genomosp. 3]RMO80036.1 Cysteine synthase [Pseudomonas syringae pv. primulae]
MLQQLINENNYIQVEGLCETTIQLKVEGLNPAGSIKLKAAHALIADLECRGLITPGTRLIESSSGNLGVALAMVCAAKGYRFVCVIDPNISAQNKRLIQTLGAEIMMVDTRDENGGYLHSRIRLIEQLVAQGIGYIWLNQYQNPANPLGHYKTTATSIAQKFPRVDYLFVGAGTTGTLMGCRNYFSEHYPDTKIIAVDAVGSVTFGLPASPRYIPGLGASRRPEIFEPSGIHAFVSITETHTIKMCRWLAQRHGLLFGGSTGTVLAGVQQWAANIRPDDVVVAISPDMGERYLETIYSDEWVSQRLDSTALQPLFPVIDLPLSA